MNASPNARDNPRTRRGRETRAALIEAARERFLIDGYLNATVPGIAAAAQRSSASFYTYFDSKSELLLTLAGEATERLRTALHVDLAGEAEGLPARISRTVWIAYRDELPVLLSIFQTAMRDLELEPWQTLRQTLVDAIASANRSVATAPLNATANDALAAALASMFEMFCFVWLGQGGDAPGTEVDEDVAVRTLAGLWQASLGAQH
jgi:AcrR family transcriptional regulator